MIVWILTVILVGTTIEFTDDKPFLTERDCKDEGYRQVRDYQQGNIRARVECEPREVDAPAGQGV